MENTPASYPENGPRRLVRDWTSDSATEGTLYDPINDEILPDPEYIVSNHGPIHEDTRDPDDSDPIKLA